MAAAAAAAGTFLEVFVARNAAEFEGLVDQFVDVFLHFVHLFLGIDKALGDRVFEKGGALGFECGNLAVVQSLTLMLFLVERTAFFGEALILLLSLGVRHEGIHPLPDALESGLPDDGFAEINSFLPHHVIDLRSCLHMAKNMRPVWLERKVRSFGQLNGTLINLD